MNALGQAIGLITAFPLCGLVMLMVTASSRAYVVGALRAEQLAMLVGAAAVRVGDGLEPLSGDDLARFRTLVKGYRDSIVSSSFEVDQWDEVLRGFAGKQSDADFTSDLVDQRFTCQQLALQRLSARCRATPSVAQLIRMWPVWAAVEELRLYRVALKRLGSLVFSHVAASVGRKTLVTAVTGLFSGVLLWVLTLAHQPKFFDYVEVGGTIGALAGFALGVVSVAWSSLVAVVPMDQRRRSRIAFGAILAYALALGPVLYFDLPGVLSRGLSGRVATVDVPDALSAALGLAVFVGWLLFNAWAAWRSFLKVGAPLSQRLDYLATALIVGVLAVFAVVATVSATIQPIPSSGSALVTWFTVVGVVACSVVGFAAWVARQRELHQSMEDFRCRGLEPEPIPPVWKVTLGWVAVTGACLGLAPMVSAVLGESADETAVTVVAVVAGLAGLVCLPVGAAHVVITRRRLKRDERRLVAESRQWLHGMKSGVDGLVDEAPEESSVDEVRRDRVVGSIDRAMVSIGGLGVNYRIGGEHTAGTYAVIECILEPGRLRPPDTHSREDVISYVLEGKVGVRLGPHESQVSSGMFVVQPRFMRHAVWNVGSEPALLLDIISPPGFEEYFRELATLRVGDGPPEPGSVEALRDRYGLTNDVAWAEDLRARHGLKLLFE